MGGASLDCASAPAPRGVGVWFLNWPGERALGEAPGLRTRHVLVWWEHDNVLHRYFLPGPALLTLSEQGAARGQAEQGQVCGRRARTHASMHTRTHTCTQHYTHARTHACKNTRTHTR